MSYHFCHFQTIFIYGYGERVLFCKIYFRYLHNRKLKVCSGWTNKLIFVGVHNCRHFERFVSHFSYQDDNRCDVSWELRSNQNQNYLHAIKMGKNGSTKLNRRRQHLPKAPRINHFTAFYVLIFYQTFGVLVRYKQFLLWSDHYYRPHYHRTVGNLISGQSLFSFHIFFFFFENNKCASENFKTEFSLFKPFTIWCLLAYYQTFSIQYCGTNTIDQSVFIM